LPRRQRAFLEQQVFLFELIHAPFQRAQLLFNLRVHGI
jgi:hypothetical protein